MRRGVDCHQFSPSRRFRGDRSLVVGYVGRLSPEKSVYLLSEIEQALQQAGIEDFRIEIAGEGSQREWLRANVPRLVDHGVLHGVELARVYAGFDIFAFPSETDTYGNVVQEAMASGVACVVTGKGGPTHIISHGVDGIVANSPRGFCDAVVKLALAPALRAQLAQEARRRALDASWDAVFEGMYRAYSSHLAPLPARPVFQSGCAPAH
jgi:glycosyltransferase involved in cell wall biosynthesis